MSGFSKITNTDNSVNGKGVSTNALGDWTQFKNGAAASNINTSWTYHTYGLLSGQCTKTGTTKNMEWYYTFDQKIGNLMNREDRKNGNIENFEYDTQDRLWKIYQEHDQIVTPGGVSLMGVSASGAAATGGAVPLHLVNTLAYDASARLQSRTDMGTFAYNTVNPYAINSVTVPQAQAAQLPAHAITNNKFNLPCYIRRKITIILPNIGKMLQIS